MRKIIFAALLGWTCIPVGALAQITPFNTYVTDLPAATSVTPSDQLYVLQGGVSKRVPLSIATPAPLSGTTCPSSGISNYQPFANTTGAPTGTTLNIWDGTNCVPWATLNQTAHLFTLTPPVPTSVTTAPSVGIAIRNSAQPTVVNGSSSIAELDHIRISQADGSPNKYQVLGTTMGGVGAVASGLEFQMESVSTSDAGSNMYGVIGQVQNDGPGTTKAIYGRATAVPGSTGAIEALVGGVTTAAGTSVAYGIQISGDTYTNSLAAPINAALWFTPNDAMSTVKARYGLLLSPNIQIQPGGAGFAMYAGGGGDFAELLNAAASAFLFQVTNTGKAGVGFAASSLLGSEALSVNGFGTFGSIGGPIGILGDTGTSTVVMGSASNHAIDIRQNNTTALTIDTNKTLNTGSGTYATPIDMGSMVTTASRIKSIVGSSGSPLATDPPSPNIVAQIWSSVADAGTVTTPILGSCMKQSTNTNAWCSGIVGDAQDNVGGNGSYVEGGRFTSRAANAGTNHSLYGVEGIATSATGIPPRYLVGVEGTTTNISGTDAPVYTSFGTGLSGSASAPGTISSSFVASTSPSTNKSDTAFLINPFNSATFRAGFVVGPGTIDSSGAVFANWSSAAVGIDLSQGTPTYSLYQILGVNGFAVNGAGAIAAPSLTASSFISAPNIFLGGGTSSFPQILRSGITAKVRLGDNSADAPLTASTVQSGARTFASIGSCTSGQEGTIAAVTDSSTSTWGATITGSSTNHVLAYCNGTNWTVAAK